MALAHRAIFFYHVGKYGGYLEHFVNSVKKHVDLPLIQLTDSKTPEIDGVDEVVRYDYSDPSDIMLNKICHIADYPCNQKILLDTDILVREDFQDVFDESFDVAMYRRSQNIGDAVFNGGVVFTKCQKFWDECAELIWSLDPKYYKWDGDQMAENRLLFSGRYKVYELPRKYNYVPDQCRRGAFNKLPTHGVPIMHFKGPLKEYMARCA